MDILYYDIAENCIAVTVNISYVICYESDELGRSSLIVPTKDVVFTPTPSS